MNLIRSYMIKLIIFNAMMFIIQTVAGGRFVGAFTSAENYIKQFGLGAIIGVIGLITTYSVITYILNRSISSERTVIFGSILLLVFGTFQANFSVFYALFAQLPIMLLFITLIELILYLVMLWTIYQWVLGGAESYK